VLFYQGAQFPKKYQNSIFIAEHGSWNRSTKIGYQLSFVRLGEDHKSTVGYEPFVTGWLSEDKETVYGRPVALLELPDGSVLLSDDYANVIYRITYSE
jgi:glucose/arabinose dehydrogenase